MVRVVTRGRVTHDYLKGFISAPEDREPAVRKLIEKAGGKVLNFYFTTGESDFLLISEAEEPEAIIAALMAAAASGAVSHVSNVRAWTGAEFKSVAERASKAGQEALIAVALSVTTKQASNSSRVQGGGKRRSDNGANGFAF